MALKIALSWSLDPTVIAGLLALCGLYWAFAYGPLAQPGPLMEAGWMPPRGIQRPVLFGFAVALLVVALESPLDFISDHYLFSAHMLQHLILILGVSPLLVLSAPQALVGWVRDSAPGWLLRIVSQPVLVFALFTVDVWAWHAPGLYDLALANEAVHALEHLSFVVTACLFWWVAFAPGPYAREMPVLARIAYVFVAAIPSSLLGAILTFSPALYPSYARALRTPGIGAWLASQGLTAAADQQLGGLLMWVPGGMVFLVIIAAIFLSWSAREEASSQAPAGTVGYRTKAMVGGRP